MATTARSKSASSGASADDSTDELCEYENTGRILTGPILRDRSSVRKMTERAFFFQCEDYWVQSALSTRGETRGSGPTSRSRSPELNDPVAPGVEVRMRKVKAARRQTGQVRTKAKKLYVDVTEEIIMNPDALPDELRGWRRYRIEYGGHAERCVLETPIYLPPWVRVERLERLLNS
jgi:hypothetical protein